MSRFGEVLAEHEFGVQYGRPKVDLPMDIVLDLHGKGLAYRQIVAELDKVGIKTSKDTVRRRIQDWQSSNSMGEEKK